MKRKIVPSITLMLFGLMSFILPLGTATSALASESVAASTSDTVIPRPDEPENNGVRVIIPDDPNVDYSYRTENGVADVYDISDGQKYISIPRSGELLVRASPETGYRFELGDNDDLTQEWAFEYDDSELETIQKPSTPSRSKNTVTIPESDEVAYYYLGRNEDGQSLPPTSVEQNEREINIPSNGELSIRAFPTSDYIFGNRSEPYTWDYEYDTSFDEPATVIERETDFTWVWIIVALAGAGILVPVALVNIRDKRDAIQSRQREQEARTKELETLITRHNETRRTVLGYETDIKLAIAYPAMNDMSEEATRNMVTAMKNAGILHDNLKDNQQTVNSTQLSEFRDAVFSFENAVEIAVNNAKRIKTSNMSEDDKKDFRLASQLLTHASDRGTPDDLRENYMKQLKKVIDRINERRNFVIPTEAVSGIEKVVRLEIEG